MANFNSTDDSSDKALVMYRSAKISFFSKMEKIVDYVNTKQQKLEMERNDQLIFVLLNLIHYKDTDLRASATRLLFHLFNQTRNLGKTLSNLQIIDERRAKESFVRSKDYCYTLDTIGDTIEKWYQNEESPDMSKLVNMLNKIYSSLFHSKAKREVDDFDIAQFNLPQTDLLRPARGQNAANFQGRKFKVTATMLNIKPQGNLTDVHQLMIDSYEERIDPFEQDLVRNTGIISSLVRMALFDVETEGKSRTNASSVLILKKVYRILAKACFENEANKEEVSQFMDTLVLKHFQESSDDLNTEFLIREAIRNNKSILLNENKVTKISRILCWAIDDPEQIDSIRKSYLLLILADMVKYNEFILTKNQTTVLSLVISKEFSNIRVQLDNHQELEAELAAKAKNKMLNKQLRIIESKKILVIPSEVCYVIAYINLLSSCAEGRNTFAENICQNLINLETLYKFIYVSDYCIVLKHALLNYFFQVYLDTDREIPFHILEIFLSIVKNLLDQFEYYAKKKFVENEDNVESVEDFSILMHHSYKPFAKWVEDYLSLLIDCMDNVVKRNLNLIADSEPARDYEKMVLNLVDFAQIAIEKFPIEEITLKLSRMIRGMYARNPQGACADKIKEKHRSIIDPKALNMGEPGLFERDRKKKRSLVQKVQYAPSYNPSSFKKSKVFLKLYFGSEAFDLKCDDEFKALVLKVRQIDHDSQYAEKNISHDSFSVCLMKYLEHSNENPEELIYLLVLKLFRKHLEFTQDRELAKPMTQWEVNEWKERSSEIIPKQNNFVRLGVPSMICKIVCEITVASIIQETLLLAICLLLGGNSLTQEAFSLYFEQDDDSLVLDKVKMHLTDSFEFVRKNMREWNNLTLKLFYLRSDTTNSQKEAQEAEISKSFRLLHIRREIEQVKEHHQICLLTFKFMQLLCEGHNKRLQNMLRQQNSGQIMNFHKSINFISLTASLWGTFIKFINPNCVDLGSIMLDFIIESTQGPCELNQKEFYYNKVVDYSKDFMNDFTTAREFESKGFKGESRQAVDDLITKTIRMLNALLEANNDKQILESISNNIEFEYLIKKLTKKFTEIFDHLNLQESHKDYTVATLQRHIESAEFEDVFSEAFEIYFFVQNIQDSIGGYTASIKTLKGVYQLAYEFFRHNTGQIEVIFQGTILRIYFMIHPICRYLDDNQKRLFLDGMNRDTPNDKVTDFMVKAPMMFDRMDYISVLTSKVKFVNEGVLANVRDTAFVIAVIINVYMLATFEKKVAFMQFVLVSNDFTPYFLYLFGSLHILASLSMIILWFFLNSKIILMDGWRERFLRFKKVLASNANKTRAYKMSSDKAIELQTIIAILNKKQIDTTRAEITQVLRFFANEAENSHPMPLLEYYTQNLTFIISNATFRFFVFYLALSIVAFSGQWVFLYSIHLLDIVVGSPSLRTVSTP